MNANDNNTDKNNTPEGAREPELSLPQKLLRGFERFGDLFVLNICFFVSCLPIITIGAAMTALYVVTGKMIDNEEGVIHKDYFKAFKANLKQGCIIWIIDLLTGFVIVSGLIRYFSDNSAAGSMPAVTIFSGALFFLASLAIPLQFPLLARYDNTVPRILINSLILAISYPGTWFKLFFIWMLPVVVYYLRPRLLFFTWYLWGMILSALFAYICSTFLKKFYKTIEEAEKSNKGESKNESKT